MICDPYIQVLFKKKSFWCLAPSRLLFTLLFPRSRDNPKIYDGGASGPYFSSVVSQVSN